MRKFFFILFILISCVINAQDIHFSQFDASPMNLNPALAGNFVGDHRITGNHRSQWRSITVNPYRTYALSYDTKLDDYIPVKLSSIGAGIQLNTDKAGDGDFGTTQIKLSPAFHRIITKDTSLIVSFGANIAFNQNSVNYSAFYFGNQWNGNQYVNDIPHNENFVEDQLIYFDFSLGANVHYVFKDGTPLNWGIAFIHLNKPKQSFFSDDVITLNRKFNTYLSSNFILNRNANFSPSIVYYNQGKFNELNIGGVIQRKLDDYNFRNLYFGGWIRAKDAGIVKFGFDYQNFLVGISYDINFSKLKIASNGRGGLELSVIYIFNNPKPYEIPFHQQCPIFM